MIASEWKRWVAIGTGVGIEIAGDDLIVTVVRVRPSGTTVLGAAAIQKFREKPAAEWGADYTAFLGRFGAAYVPATVLLPRKDVIVRQVTLPGVADRDLASAIQYQADSLHPFSEDDAVLAWRRVGAAGTVLVGITRRTVIEEVMTVFNEAGVKVAALTFSASVLYSASRLYSTPPAAGFLVLHPFEGGVEAYGESPSRPVFSASFLNGLADRAPTLAAAELRLEGDVAALDAASLLPPPKKAPDDVSFQAMALSYASALSDACPRLAPPVNLLPEDQRAAASRAIFVPTVILAVALTAVLVGLLSYKAVADRRYIAALNAESARLAPVAGKVAQLDKATQAAYAKVRTLDEFRMRTRNDIDSIHELTRVLAPPTFLSSMEMTRTAVNLAGESEHTEPLLKSLDESRLFQSSEFVTSSIRSGKVEVFRVRTMREGAAK